MKCSWTLTGVIYSHVHCATGHPQSFHCLLGREPGDLVTQIFLFGQHSTLSPGANYRWCADNRGSGVYYDTFDLKVEKYFIKAKQGSISRSAHLYHCGNYQLWVRAWTGSSCSPSPAAGLGKSLHLAASVSPPLKRKDNS